MKVSKTSTAPAAILGFLYPFGGLLYSIWNYRKPYAKVLFYVFCLFVGYTFIYQAEGTEVGSGIDSARYARNLMHAFDNQISWSQAIAFHGSVDYYSGTVTYLLSRFTSNGKILFLVYAAIMGYFLTQNLWFVIERLKGRVSGPTVILLVLLALVCPIWLVNGVRMWTALHVFLFGALRFIYFGEKKNLIWPFVSIFIHFSFLFPFAFLVIYILAPTKNLSFYFGFFVISFFINEIDFEFIRNFLYSYMPENMQPRIGYIDDDYMARAREAVESRSIHVRYRREAYKYIVLVLGTVAYYQIAHRHIQPPEWLTKLFRFSLFFYGVSLIMSLAPTGHRYLFLANSFILSCFVLLTNINGFFLLRKTTHLLFPFLFLLIFIEMRMGLGFLGPITFLGNFILTAFIEINIPIIVYLKDLLV